MIHWKLTNRIELQWLFNPYVIYIVNLKKLWYFSITCSIVTTCLSPDLLHTGIIPSFMATRPTLRLPGEMQVTIQWNHINWIFNKHVHKHNSFLKTSSRLEARPTFLPLMSGPGLILKGVESVLGHLIVFLSSQLLQKGSIILCQVLIPPCVRPMRPHALNDRSSAEWQKQWNDRNCYSFYRNVSLESL